MGLLAAVLRRERSGRRHEPSAPPGSGPSPRSTGAGSPASTCWTRSGVWDDVTAGVVLARLAPPNDLGFFTQHERAVAEPLLDLLLAQDSEPRVPVLALIDTRLAIGETDGWHYDDLPEDGQAWRDTLAVPRPGRRSIDTASRFARLRPRRAGAADPGRAGPRAPHGRAVARLSRPPRCGACGPGTPAPRSTPTPGRGTRSASPARPTRAGTCNPGVNARERWEVADRPRSTSTRCRSPAASNGPARAHADLTGRRTTGTGALQ